MFEAVQCFQSGSAPKLSASKQHYEVVEGEVHYVDPISRVPDSSISYGYTTAFTYFHCRELGKLAWKDVRAHVKIQPVCATLSYSEIPKFYQCCLGMTGTLDCECIVYPLTHYTCKHKYAQASAHKQTFIDRTEKMVAITHCAGLTAAQNRLLREYGFQHQTYLPSTFARQKLNSKQKADHTQTQVIYGSYDEYFEVIVRDVERELHAGRAILIVFADSTEMTRYNTMFFRSFNWNS